MVMMSQIKKSKSKDIQPKVKPSGKLAVIKGKTGKNTGMKVTGGNAEPKVKVSTTPAIDINAGKKPSIVKPGHINKVLSKGATRRDITPIATGKDASAGSYNIAKQNVAGVYARRAKQGL